MLSATIYRISRGNAITTFMDSPETFYSEGSGAGVRKSIFTIITSGTKLPSKIAKVCMSMEGRMFQVPRNPEPYIRRLRLEISRLRSVLTVTRNRVRSSLRKFANPYTRQTGVSVVRYWQYRLERERKITEALMRCRHSAALVSFSGWVPASEVRKVHSTVDPYTDGDSRVFLHVQGEDSMGRLNSKLVPPTYFKVNKWTSPFQGIVDTYGIARYREINPGLFTIVTFPFTFGVMYGDMGHGLALFLCAVYLIATENRLEALEKRGQLSEILTYAFHARYALLPMGLFALYCGTIYNDCLSVPFPLFASSWAPANYTAPPNTTMPLLFKVKATESYTPYPYGVDWGWYNTGNELAFFNSLKMKMSVILGVIHMVLGICLSAFNYVHFGDRLGLWSEWVPRIAFMLSTFGYMCFMIIYKWTVDYGCQDGTALSLSCPAQDPPSLIQTMIKMFLSPGTVENPLYEGQAGVQVFLILIAVLSVPVMLLMKPLVLRYGTSSGGGERHGSERARQRGRQEDSEYHSLSLEGNSDEEDSFYERKRLHQHTPKHEGVGDDKRRPMREEELEQGGEVLESDRKHDEGHAHESFGEMMIHQGIHTIEFVLGCVSNTASYLRLWALSLAHAQLASVFWSKFIVQALEYGSAVALVAGFCVWFFATVAVLLCMDLLECFLHALRLHWVEFQNKFYAGDGIKFEPFVLPTSAEAYNPNEANI